MGCVVMGCVESVPGRGRGIQLDAALESHRVLLSDTPGHWIFLAQS